MKLGILLLIIGLVLVLYLSNIKIEKRFLSNIGIVFGVLLLIYGMILTMQPDDFIAYTKTTISQEAK